MRRLVLVLALVGCNATAQQEQAVIDEGCALVESWAPDGPVRAAYKAKWLADAAPFRSPAPAPSPSPSPTPGGVK